MRPRLALVPGEPGGIGPELCVRLAQSDRDAQLIAFADPQTLLSAAQALGLPLTLRAAHEDCAAGELAVQPFTQMHRAQFGHADPANASFVIDTLLHAAHACLEGKFHGLVTGPVHKASINAGGIAYTGTTELLAEQANADVVMMLATASLRVALATTHLPLREVPAAITSMSLTRTLRILHTALQGDFNIAKPCIAVLGLNPHAGENGVLGNEELQIIEPVLETLRREGMELMGPLPADSAFLPQKLASFDAVLAMYHDQGLPVLKHSGFEQAVNITLGLPYPRVAVDHGTALELAGRGSASASSLFAAVEMCTQLAQQRMRG